MQKAKIQVYLQAQGAHFLGAHAYDADNIRVNLSYRGGEVNLPYSITPNFTTDGLASLSFVPGASSFMPIITVPIVASGEGNPIHFLSTDFTTACALGEIDLPDSIEQVTVTASVPTTSGNPLLMKYPIILNPMQTAYSVIIVVPGLFLSCATLKGQVAVYVKMMCGCPVTLGPPASLWPADDFAVTALVTDVSGTSSYYTLTYDKTQTGNSLFSAPLLLNQKTIKNINFLAIQRSTGNCGVLMEMV